VNEPELTLPELRVRDRLVEPSIVDLDSAVSERSESSLPLLDANSWPTPSVAEAASPAQHSDVAELPSAAQARTDEEPTDAIAAVQQPAEGPRLNWPPEEARRIVALRVTARNGERFTGASLRQALLGEGFVLGELDIFHRPLADGRVLLSAASLTRPGGFDLNTMDSTLFLGLNLFAVLPGPMPGRDTVDKLLLAGHTLAQRLRGELRDSAGEVLTEVRLAEMRREAASADG
jgi:cell division protein ZipA